MKMCSVGKFIRISMDRQTIKLPLVMKNYNFHLFITTGLIFVQFPIGGFQLVANHLFAKQFCSLLQNLHCPKFPNSAFHKDWYPQNSQKWCSYCLISKFKHFLCNCRFGFVPSIFNRMLFACRGGLHWSIIYFNPCIFPSGSWLSEKS